ncbi:MAG: DoxX family protein, partial [bacterium]
MTTQTITSAVTLSAPRSITRYTTPIARILLGLVFFVFGLDGFFHFIPQPTEPPSEPALSFAMGLLKSGYMFPLIKGTEVAVGALLLSNRFVALALVVIAPVIVNIFAFHAFLAPSGIVIAGALVVLAAYLAWVHRSAYRPLFAS